jgi:hypothetical protein
MKKKSPFTHQIQVILFFLLVSTSIFSQNKKSKDEPLFGKNITAKSTNPKTGIIRCATVEYEQYLQEKNPNRMTNEQFENWLAPLVKKEAALRKSAKTKAAVIITIPVVVHVIHNGEAIGTAPNITDAQVQSQITVLNQDFRKMMGTPGHNSNPDGADVEIEFVLAKQDPNGNPTNGIDRVNMCASSWSNNDIENIVKPNTIWDPEQYLNMWTVKFTDTKLLGYAQFPSNSTLDGISEYSGSALTDGVVSAYDNFGSSDLGTDFLLFAGYDKGRTMTHEVGHYLGLLHIWGDGNGDESENKPDCTASDFCADTPQAGWEHYDCDNIYDTCPAAGNDMTENYMDYTDDTCMNIFTLDQKDRIMAVMNNSIRRKTLTTSTKDDAITIYAIDAEVKNSTDYCSAKAILCSSLPAPTNKKITLTNRGSSTLTSASIKYSINGGTQQSQSWTGSLAQNQSTEVILLNTATSGILTTTIDSVNGTTDQRTTNNTNITSYEPLNFNYTNYVFTLQQDYWGSETTWDLKDGSGAILYSGGPYTDKDESSMVLPDLITQNWTLASNQCYTFTINDSQGDGICCEGGNGYYNIKSSDGSKTIKSGGSFVDNELAFFTTNTLGISDNEELLNEIYLFPNPTKGTLTIQIPSNFGLPNSYEINTVLGQKMSQKEVSKESDLTIDTSHLSNGIYFISIVKEDQKRILRFIKE